MNLTNSITLNLGTNIFLSERFTVIQNFKKNHTYNNVCLKKSNISLEKYRVPYFTKIFNLIFIIAVLSVTVSVLVYLFLKQNGSSDTNNT